MVSIRQVQTRPPFHVKCKVNTGHQVDKKSVIEIYIFISFENGTPTNKVLSPFFHDLDLDRAAQVVRNCGTRFLCATTTVVAHYLAVAGHIITEYLARMPNSK